MAKHLRHFFLLALLWCAQLAMAQGIVVESFRLLETDQTANIQGSMKRDQNNEVAALIKVVTTEKDFVFDGGMMGIVDTDRTKTGEVWVYVSRGMKKISILHDKLGVLRDYYFPVSIEAARTYEMTLTTGKVETIVTRSAGKQYVMFSVSPVNATIELDGMPLEVDSEGFAEKSMAYGTYDYRVSCANYHTEAGKLTVSSQGKVEMNISLKPNFGWIKLEGDEESLGADVYINGERVGQLPFKTKEMKSGTYAVKVAKNMYKGFEEQVTVKDNETLMLNVHLQPNFGWVKLEGATEFHGAHVYVDNERVGQLPLTTSELVSGIYRLKVLKPLYKPFEQQVTVTDNNTTILQVDLIPNFARVTFTTDTENEVWVDGRQRGKGKCTLDLEFGEYNVEVKRASHRTVSDVITITDLTERTIQLSSPTPIYGVLDISSSPSRATVFIDGVEKGQTPMILDNVLVGSRKVTLKKEGYEPYEKDMLLQENADNTLAATLEVEKPKFYNGAKKTYTVNGVSFTMIDVEGGTFTMGATSEQGSDAGSDEKPTHEVTLSNYSIGETEVTQELWQAVMGSNPSNFKGDLQRPVECVSWNDCQTFINKLNQLTGENFRLPTEAEWEYAARGGKESKGYKYSGSNTIGKVAWFTDNSSSTTHAVKTKQPNELGLYDMSGNVWEWCADWFSNSYYASSPASNPTGPSSGSLRVLRGGSWYLNAWYCRVAYCSHDSPDYRNDDGGFRLSLQFIP